MNIGEKQKHQWKNTTYVFFPGTDRTDSITIREQKQIPGHFS